MHDYDHFAATVRAEYAAFLGGLVAQYMTVTASGAGQQGAVAFRRDANRRIAQLTARARTLARQYTAVKVAGDVTDPRSAPWVASLHKVAIKNANDLVQRLMGANDRLANLLNRDAGAVGLLLQQKISQPTFVAYDRVGRKWDAAMLVNVMARDFAYQSSIDATLARLAGLGVTQVRIVHDNPDHPNHGVIMPIGEVAAVREFIFHPNAHAGLEAYVSA